MKISPAERILLEEVWQEIQNLESRGGPFAKAQLTDLEKLLLGLSDSANPSLKKIGELDFHLQEGMSLRQLHLLLVPIERLLDRNRREDQFLTTSTDRKLEERISKPLVFVLDHLRSGFNVGSLFRLADCVGAEKIWLVGYTATPDQKAVQDTALGTSQWVPWEHIDDLQTLIVQLQAKGFQVVALETAERATSLYAGKLPDKVAFIVGNERFGLGPECLSKADQVRSIPMQGQKNSLNVASALAVAAFEWSRQHS